MTKHLIALAGLAAPLLARAHEGHGLPGSAHWHADDALKLVALSLAAVAGLWLLRRK